MLIWRGQCARCLVIPREQQKARTFSFILAGNTLQSIWRRTFRRQIRLRWRRNDVACPPAVKATTGAWLGVGLPQLPPATAPCKMTHSSRQAHARDEAATSTTAPKTNAADPVPTWSRGWSKRGPCPRRPSSASSAPGCSPGRNRCRPTSAPILVSPSRMFFSCAEWFRHFRLAQFNRDLFSGFHLRSFMRSRKILGIIFKIEGHRLISGRGPPPWFPSLAVSTLLRFLAVF